ncbi:MAG: alpha-galactosidase [Thermoguttaceae bacterium]|nr:alpha-galactosidase [Thermoguttaceae bacterium]
MLSAILRTPSRLQSIFQRTTIGVVLGMLAGVWAGATPAYGVNPSREELQKAQQFAQAAFDPKAPAQWPFSFVYAGKRSVELLPAWPSKETTEPLDAQRIRRRLVWADPATGLEVCYEGILYQDFPVVEWKLTFRAVGQKETPILEQVYALDVSWQRADKEEFLLHHAAGSQANRSDYAPRETPLGPKAELRLAGAGGRPTNVHWSYFNLQWGQQGVIIAVGWPGQWFCQFRRDEAQQLCVQAGQEQVHTKLLPGEEFHSPRMVLLFWQGDYLRSQNLWRRWMMAHNMPRPGGRLPPPQFVASSSRAYEEMIHANEENQIMHINRYLEEGLKIDYWWMDAGWYIQQHGWPQVGTWEVDPKRFPRGLRAISDHAHARGVKILVWFEPERVMPGTWLYQNRPQWLLRPKPAEEYESLAGLRAWTSKALGGPDPCVTYNSTAYERRMAGIRWTPGRLSFHPGPKGEYSVVRFQAPDGGQYQVQAKMLGIDRQATTDVHILAGARSLFTGQIDMAQKKTEAQYQGQITLEKGQTVDFVVGWGNGNYFCDTTGLEVEIRGPGGQVFDPAKQFQADKNPAGVWSYGWLKPGPKPDPATFSLYDQPREGGDEGPRLLNLGNPEARQWLVEHIDRLLTEQGIDLYRQDFNIDPLPFWRAADAPDRQGMTENQYVRGYLAYWDELLRRRPNMLIDSCASGGRRNDLETMRRAVPLWRSDYAYEPIGHQCMTYGISLWLPYHGTGTVAYSRAPYYGGGRTPVEPYAFWSNAAPSLGCGIDIRVPDLDYNTLRRLYHAWRRMSQFYYGDFYPLTPYSQDERAWIGWQFHDPASGAGAVQVFRRQQAADDEVRLKLRELDPTGLYVLETLEPPGETEQKTTGRQLVEEGLRIKLSDRPAAAVLLYRRAE